MFIISKILKRRKERRRKELRKILSKSISFIQTTEDLRYGTKLGYNVYLRPEIIEQLVEFLIP